MAREGRSSIERSEELLIRVRRRTRERTQRLKQGFSEAVVGRPRTQGGRHLWAQRVSSECDVVARDDRIQSVMQKLTERLRRMTRPIPQPHQWLTPLPDPPAIRPLQRSLASANQVAPLIILQNRSITYITRGRRRPRARTETGQRGTSDRRRWPLVEFRRDGADDTVSTAANTRRYMS